MSLDDVIIPPESAEEAQLRRNLQSSWWEKLAARPAATLHRHITPGKLLMFGSESGEQCLIAPGISLDYVVFADSSGISLHCDRVPRRGVAYWGHHRFRRQFEPIMRRAQPIA